MMDGNSSDLLDINNHKIDAVFVNEGSVERWQCLECGMEAEDAIEYVDTQCNE